MCAITEMNWKYKVIYVTDEIDHLVACRRLEAWGITIDSLTDEQESYLNSWNV